MLSCHYLLKIHDTSTVYMIQINALCVIYFFILFIFKSPVVFLLEYGCEIQLQVFFCVLYVVVAFCFFLSLTATTHSMSSFSCIILSQGTLVFNCETVTTSIIKLL